MSFVWIKEKATDRAEDAAASRRKGTPMTLNGTAVTDRFVLAILENFGGEVPDALQPYGAPAAIRR